MTQFWVGDGALDALESTLEGIRSDAAAARGRFPGDTGGLGWLTGTQDAAVERWLAGLRTGEAALGQAADSVGDCARAYRTSDDDQSVTFVGLTR